MRRALSMLLAILLGSNGLWMIFAPFHWYARIPGVPATGPANAHFIRDVGCVYLVTAAALLWQGFAPGRAWPATLFGGSFLFLHACMHVWDTAAGREHPLRLLTEIPTIVLPALLTLWLGSPPNSISGKEL